MREVPLIFTYFFYTVVLLLTNLNQHIPAWKHNQFRLLIKAPHSAGESSGEKKNQAVFIYFEGDEGGVGNCKLTVDSMEVSRLICWGNLKKTSLGKT